VCSDLCCSLLCSGYATFVRVQDQLHGPRQVLMLQLDSLLQISDMITSEQHVSVLDLLSTLEHSLGAGRHAHTTLSALVVKTCTLEQLARLMVYSYPYWCKAAPCRLGGGSFGYGRCQKGLQWDFFEFGILTTPRVCMWVCDWLGWCLLQQQFCTLAI
jgi:hypothetical protein